jgi:hypothetical protein
MPTGARTRATGDFDLRTLRHPGLSDREDRRVASGHERLRRLAERTSNEAAAAARLRPRRHARTALDRARPDCAVPDAWRHLIGATVLSLTFSNAVIRGLNTVIVDADRTPTSLQFVQAIAAAPGIGLHSRTNDLTAAMHAIRSGAALAAAYIPGNFGRDLAAGRRPQISLFYNTQFMTPGNAASKALQDAVQGGIAAVAAKGSTQPRTIGSLVVEQYVLTNPALNYAQFCCAPSCRRSSM